MSSPFAHSFLFHNSPAQISGVDPSHWGPGTCKQCQGCWLSLPMGTDPPEEPAPEKKWKDLPPFKQVTSPSLSKKVKV